MTNATDQRPTTTAWSPPDWTGWMLRVEAGGALLVGLSCLALGHVGPGLFFLVGAAVLGLLPGLRAERETRSGTPGTG